MTLGAILLLVILGGTVVLFCIERVPPDLVAFVSLLLLVLCRFLEPQQAFIGFSSDAVVTMIAMFIVGASLNRCGIAELVALRLYRWVGSSETWSVTAVMLLGVMLSAFMNNVAAVAVLMPAVVNLSQRSGIAVSRLLIPLSAAVMLGGTLTLIGTTPNLVVADLLVQRGLEPFHFFSFTSYGLVLSLLGIAFMATIGRRLLPATPSAVQRFGREHLSDLYHLRDSLFVIRVPHGTFLHGQTLSGARLRQALGVHVVSIIRGGQRILAPASDQTLFGGDTLLVRGRRNEIDDLLRYRGLQLDSELSIDTSLLAHYVSIAVYTPAANAIGKPLHQAAIRGQFGVLVVAIERAATGDGAGRLLYADLGKEILRKDDRLYLVGRQDQLDLVSRQSDALVRLGDPCNFEELFAKGLFVLGIGEGSELAECTVIESRLGELAGVTVVALLRGDQSLEVASGATRLKAGDRLIVVGDRERMLSLLGLSQLEIGLSEGEVPDFESEEIGIVEVVMPPRSQLIGKTLQELRFRERYGFNVLGLWRDSTSRDTRLGRIPLQLGDALLLQGPRGKISFLLDDPDFLVLTATVPPARLKKAPYALLGLLITIVVSAIGFMPVSIAAFSGALFVILSGAIRMEECYRHIEWRVVFLVAALFPIGIAIEQTGVGAWLAGALVDSVGRYGIFAVILLISVLASLLSQLLDSVPAVVLLTPVALAAARSMGVDPHPLAMALTLSASNAFLHPLSHRAHLLVKSAGGYTARDYFRVGIWLTLMMLITVVVGVYLVYVWR